MIYALIVVVAVLTALQLIIRTNTAIVFFAVCAGSVLLAAAGKNTDLLTSSFAGSVSNNTVQAIVVLMPAVVTAFVLRKRISKSRMLFAVIPALSASVVALTLVYPFLSGSFQTTLNDSKGWPLIAQYYEVIVMVGIVSSLVTLAVTIPKHGHDGRHKKGKH